MKSRQVNGVGHGLRRRLRTANDRDWSEPLPIYAFAIEHPKGVIWSPSERTWASIIRSTYSRCGGQGNVGIT